MKMQYKKPEVSQLGSTSDATKSQNLSNADDSNIANSANPFVPPDPDPGNGS